ncbi:MAG: hypothetical protein A2445_01965 [Candidatus Jacksonbacteria bacterium RIFOXYC2_FULL_44_29]|nr:MAG: hypothetical protein A2240_03270 [Candidatus Jacksonbacteria bacterium RIFOXYA2_FULL_43_12]OGY75832.1 MAG: hypothetical protein A2295_00160 [Candidatus Jacksonbacteria bacterium RIFOXYB2_FULL_44_15]OGY77892.1 MAG: hypothetical protein A2445_01965 [Candidatus Jacksonbacteria bacterium RIFOXYC2_FULL_44_29]OGY80124.1 MAG: hypothetical protein A2550_05425 [Candidatus Jacksonbacteria bacterium RIFOXYD2_FULL_43_21]HBH46096.1 hypothetical protein [Candidatus Jacksonbacteria bacterium]
MKKIETIWHHILWSALEKRQFKHTQKSLAEFFGYSLSTVNHALTVPSQTGAIRKETKFFVLADFKKLLYYWASIRNLEKDIIYKTNYEASIPEIEGLLPASAIYAGYSAGRFILKEAPADYAKVYFYLDEADLGMAKDRFPENKKNPPNLFILKASPTTKKYGAITTLPQTFVDIWNLKDWYGQDFIKKLTEKIDGILS